MVKHEICEYIVASVFYTSHTPQRTALTRSAIDDGGGGSGDDDDGGGG